MTSKIYTSILALLVLLAGSLVDPGLALSPAFAQRTTLTPTSNKPITVSRTPISDSIPATPSAPLIKALLAVPGITYISPEDGLALYTNPKLLLITAYASPESATLNTAKRLYAAAYPLVGTPLRLTVEFITGDEKTLLFTWDTKTWTSDTNEIVPELLPDIQQTATSAAESLPTPTSTRQPPTRVPTRTLLPTRTATNPPVSLNVPAAPQACPSNCKECVARGMTAQQCGQCKNLDRDNDGVACYGD